MKQLFRWFAILVLALALLPADALGQYFGQNKPSYRRFQYKVKFTPNFEIYHYFDDDVFLRYFTNRAEEWYFFHQQVFRDTIKERNPLIIYSTHADFQQTTTTSSEIGVGTGGFTEALKNRVVMPAAHTIAQTDHVLGHELVHAFHFNRLLRSDSSRYMNMRNIPLWLIEGMAEYFSIGGIDPNTAMWMRDALVNDDFPTLQQMSTDGKYFPYRYGHALMAFIGKTWGDQTIARLFERTALHGLDKALDSIVGFNSKVMSAVWKTALQTYYEPFIRNSSLDFHGKKLISLENSGRMNLSPSLSPDGKYLAYFSEKSLFSLDLFIAEAGTGKIVRKVSSLKRSHEIDNFSFLESGGTWSPDSRKYAFVVFSRGRNVIAIIDVNRGRIEREITIPGVWSITNPEWSPDGRYMVFNGLVNGLGNLYMYDMETEKYERLTSNFYSSIHPAWSPDGKYLVFSGEVVNTNLPAKKYGFNISILNMENREIRMLDLFPGADNLNPRFSFDGRSIYFLSNADGFRNLYKYNLDLDKLFRLTNYTTGISGMTPFSPAISTARDVDLIAFTCYFKGNYEIHTAMSDEFSPVEADRYLINYDAGVLPPAIHSGLKIVDALLYSRREDTVVFSPDSVFEVPFRPRFKLDYISNNASIGVSTGRYYNNNMGGSVNMIFSDIVGNNTLYSTLALNGEIYDFGGQTAYINQARKLKWGGSVSHIPYRSGMMYWGYDSLKIGDEKYLVNNLVLDYLRMFEDNISFFTFFPLTTSRRFEAGASASWYYYRIDRFNHYYDLLGYPIGVKREKMPVPSGSNYQIIDMAYIADNSVFGMTAPMTGSRMRIGVEKYFSAVNFFTGLFDFRQYYFSKPVGLAFRAYHYGRYGFDSGSGVIYPLYLGYPWLIRGYENISFYGSPGSLTGGSFNVSHLSGSKIAVANAEIRIPFTGPERLALIKSKLFFSDFNLFFDAGLAWNTGDRVKLRWGTIDFNERIPVFSAGASLRINLFGALIVEPYYAFPFQDKGNRKGVFAVNFVPGW